MIRWSAACLCVALSATGAAGQFTTYLYGSHTSVGSSETTLVPESSGVVASRYNRDIFWTHNDSGATYARVYAFRLSAADKAAGVGKHMGYVELPTATNVDWEDISAGPGHWIYVFDGGDNPACDRTAKHIHRFVEPTVDPNASPVALTAACDSIWFEYPDSSNPALPADSNAERYDAECLMVHPVSGDIYVVTKRDTNNTYVARVYKLPATSIAWNSSQVHVLQFVADISSRVPSMVTGGDINADGRRLVIRNYTTAYEFILPVGQAFDTVFQQTPTAYTLWAELLSQGEGICYATFDGDIITTTEAPSDGKFRINAIPWRLANVRAEDLTNSTAVIRWDTATAAASRVDYGLTTSYGLVATDGSSVTAHAVTLTGLTTGSRYYYQVKSGSLQYPDTGHAAEFGFVARYFFRSDFDQDGDVDLADFAHLQCCLAGPTAAISDPNCLDADLNGDDHVDSADLSRLLACMSGAEVQPDPACRETHMIDLIMIACLGWPGAAVPSTAESAHTWGSEEFAATSETDLVPESSGVIPSRLARDVYWTHNDSGSEHPRVWAFRLSPADRQRHVAHHLGYVELPGASNHDWEDIAAGPGGRIYVFDGGDNPPCKRTGKHIIRFVEPKIDPDGPAVALTADYESIHFEYPDPADASRPASRDDDRYDAECLFVHPVTGDMYIVTKRTNANRPIARVYKLPADKLVWSPPGKKGKNGARARVYVLQFVTELNATTMNMVTAGDIDRAGRRVVLRNYWEAFEYELPAGKPFDEIFRVKPRQIPLLKQAAMMLQGEGICYSADGRDLIMTTESPQKPKDQKFRVFIVPGTGPQTGEELRMEK